MLLAATLAVPAPAQTAPATQDTPSSAPASQPVATQPAAIQPVATQPATTQAATTQPAEPQRADLIADAYLAEHFCQAAQNSLRVKDVSEATFARSAVLLEVAGRLNAYEPRYPALRAEIMLQLKDAPGALAALNAYRKLVPADETAQNQVIDLHVLGKETADARVDYLKDLVSKEKLPPAVRSHAATLAARIYNERGQATELESMLQEALRLNPLNIDALQMRYQLFTAAGPAFERVTTLLSMLRANPMQIETVMLLAETLADVGLTEPALKWYGYGSQLSPKVRQPISARYALGYAATLFIAGQPASADQLLMSVLQAQPENVDACLLKIVIDRAMENADSTKIYIRRARNAIRNQMAVVRNSAGDEAATTRPVDAEFSEPVEAAAELDRVKASGKPELENAYTAMLVDLAWLELYFNRDADAAVPILAALEKILPADSATLARLVGWRFLVSGRFDEAKVKLSAVQDKDPLAALGMVSVLDKSGSRATADGLARRIVNENPSGLLGSILSESLRSRGAWIVPGESAEAISGELEKFPAQWLDIVDRPHQFYALRAEPLAITYQFGQPILVKVSVTNLTNLPITIGAGGVLRPDLWFDSYFRGASSKVFPGVAYDRLSQKIVLQPRETSERIVRLDQGQLGEALQQSPSVAIPVGATVMTNPMPGEAGMSAGASGYRVQLSRLLERAGTPISTDDDKQKLYAQINSGDPMFTMSGAYVLASYAGMIRGSAGENRPLALASEFAQRVERMSFSAQPAVSAWSGYLSALLTPAETRIAAIEKLLQSEHWRARALGILMVQTLAPDLATPILSAARADKDDLLTRLAITTAEALRPAPATAP